MLKTMYVCLHMCRKAYYLDYFQVAKLTLFSMLEELVMNNMEDPLDSTGSDEVLANAAILLSECYHTSNTDIEQVLKNMLLHTQTSYHIKGKVHNPYRNVSIYVYLYHTTDTGLSSEYTQIY